MPLAASAIVVPTVLAGLTLLWPRPGIETELTRTAGEALGAAGIPGAQLALRGRDVIISGVSEADRLRAIATVEGVSGVRIATIGDAAAPATGGANPTIGTGPVVDESFRITRGIDKIVVSGVIGSESERAALIAAATAKAGGLPVVDDLTVKAGATLPGGVDATSVGSAVAALIGTGGNEGIEVGFTSGGITLNGVVADDAAKAAAAAAITAALPGLTVDNLILVDPNFGVPPGSTPTGTAAGTPAETPSAAPSDTPAPGTGDLDAAAKSQLQSTISGLLAAAPIGFGPDSPQLTPLGSATVAKVLDAVKSAPGARLQVDGFVARGVGNGKLSAQELSDQRAAAVRDALVAGGVPADRITARGLGEGNTPADRAAGRRVEITVV